MYCFQFSFSHSRKNVIIFSVNVLSLSKQALQVLWIQKQLSKKKNSPKDSFLLTSIVSLISQISFAKLIASFPLEKNLTQTDSWRQNNSPGRITDELITMWPQGAAYVFIFCPNIHPRISSTIYLQLTSSAHSQPRRDF